MDWLALAEKIRILSSFCLPGSTLNIGLSSQEKRLTLVQETGGQLLLCLRCI